MTRDLCRRFDKLKLTADLSHFCVVAERVFAADDDDWAEVLHEVANHTRHIHARVGYAQGPQVRCAPDTTVQGMLTQHTRACTPFCARSVSVIQSSVRAACRVCMCVNRCA